MRTAVVALACCVIVAALMIWQHAWSGSAAEQGGVVIVRARPITATADFVHPSPPSSISVAGGDKTPFPGRHQQRWSDDGSVLQALAVKLRSEGRDPVWAQQGEQQLTTRLRGNPLLADLPAYARCGRTLCKIAGVLPRGMSGNDVSTALQSLQDARMRSALTGGTLVGGPTIQPGSEGARYLLFYRRGEQRPTRTASE